ncbi:beta-galactosidase-like protein [Hungatella effluvii]|uniref:Beta-galactosidase n=2 Tax=Hungatella effluvii TaxID=1096246 RepID=A0A2V3Y1N4_9FIRM|nr:beta-galactosidase-like protein [Hungatella effluvii]
MENKMNNYLNIKDCVKKNIFPLSEKFYGKDPVGNEIGFTNYYMTMNGNPYFGISGECHYSRIHESEWEDTILKMKMGGINIIATYCFWNHHEEEEGVFRFDGCRNIRAFIQLCQKHGMYVIVRIGPFDHGEVRNGGLPDWLYGKPFDVRSINDGFIFYTKRLYKNFAEQFQGLYFKDGGPIIGAQIENEYMHSGAPWEMTTGVTNEWVPGGSDGNAYMLKLKELAIGEGIVTPFYTCTGWGGAAAPTDEMLPLWGGYAFWPWIFYNYRGEHPLTPEYIYREYHNNDVPATYNFEPAYEPESLPYSCCEMGGGMTCYYQYRFQLPYESVDAMANIKLAGGCNFLGYYMYRGGTNPKGVRNTYLNECQCPKLSYDYQAAIGEYGQTRPSYYRLRALHMLTKNFPNEFCKTVTILPEGSQEIQPSDVDTLRYAVRTDGTSGFLFINNYQDHTECKEKQNTNIALDTQKGEVLFKDISISAGEEVILPFNFNMAGYELRYAKAQLLSVITEKDSTTYFFFMPEGMMPEFVWNGENITSVNGKTLKSPEIRVKPVATQASVTTLDGIHGKVKVILLTRAQSLMYSEIEWQQEKVVLLCDTAITYDGDNLRLETPAIENNEVMLYIYPNHSITELQGAIMNTVVDDIFTGVKIRWEDRQCRSIELPFQNVGVGKYTVNIPKEFHDCRELLLQIKYQGDIGQAFVNSEMISDNFCNGDIWEIGLKKHWDLVMNAPVTIVVTPLKKGSSVNVSSTMAGRLEENNEQIESVDRIHIKPVYQASIKLK